MDKLQDEVLALKLYQPGSTNRQEHHPNDPPISLDPPEQASNPPYDNSAKRIMNRSTIIPSHNHPGQFPGNTYSNTDFRSYSNTESSSRGRHNVPPVHVHPDREREQLADDIKENTILQNIDREIEHVADQVRRQTLKPQTEEFLNDDNDDPSLGPYDPNLVCQGCGMRYRYGEIQKLRRHINEFCVVNQYTLQQGHN